jgi:hypothetical protein
VKSGKGVREMLTKFLPENLKEKGPLGRPTILYEDNIRIGLKETEWDGVDLM